MITINCYEDLKPYEQIVPVAKNCELPKILYKFTENGKFADVTFNFNINISYESLKEKYGVKVDDEFFVECEIKAKNIRLNSEVNCNVITATNLFVADICNCQAVSIKNNIKAFALHCNCLSCNNIECEVLTVQSKLKCNSLKAKDLYLCNSHLENISTERVNWCHA